MDDRRVTPQMALRAAFWLLVETGVLVGLAVALTLVIAGIRTYYGPDANPPWTTESWYVLLTVAIIIAGWRCVRRLRRYLAHGM